MNSQSMSQSQIVSKMTVINSKNQPGNVLQWDMSCKRRILNSARYHQDYQGTRVCGGIGVVSTTFSLQFVMPRLGPSIGSRCSLRTTTETGRSQSHSTGVIEHDCSVNMWKIPIRIPITGGSSMFRSLVVRNGRNSVQDRHRLFGHLFGICHMVVVNDQS